MSERDLVIIALSGVQRYIEESRTTADLHSASQIIAELAAEAVRRLESTDDVRVVFPAAVDGRARGAGDGMPNRVVALVPEGTGPALAGGVQAHLDKTWNDWVGEIFGRSTDDTPGWPAVQWVSVPPDVGDYPEQWRQAQTLLARRKNIRDFQQPVDGDRELCTLSPRWRSVRPPGGRLPEHLRKEDLSPPNWVKRRWKWKVNRKKSGEEKQEGFPSTKGIASADFRAALLEDWARAPGAQDLDGSVQEILWGADRISGNDIPETPIARLPEVAKNPNAAWLRGRGAQWVYPGSWHLDSLAYRYGFDRNDEERLFQVEMGCLGVDGLMKAACARGIDPPSSHLAVLVQDIDSMGRYLSGRMKGQGGDYLGVSEGEHARVSNRLSEIAAEQREAVEAALGVVVYSGGDDLLALVPASTALDTARACHDTVRAPLPTASTGLLFLHHDSSLQEGVQRAHALLKAAKRRDGKHGLGIGYIRNSGAHADCVLGWDDGGPEGDGMRPEEALRVFVPQGDNARIRLSPRLLADLAAEQVPLAGGQAGPPESWIIKAEIRRLIERHTTLAPPPDGRIPDRAADAGRVEAFGAEAVKALERMAPGRRLFDEDAVRVAVFLRQEVL